MMRCYQEDGKIIIFPTELFCRLDIGEPGAAKSLCPTRVSLSDQPRRSNVVNRLQRRLSSNEALRKHLVSHGLKKALSADNRNGRIYSAERESKTGQLPVQSKS